MNSIVVFCLLSVVAVALARPEQYTDRYDNIDLDDILNNHRLLKAYVECILDVGKCTPDGNELKEHIREALENKCDKCTETQKTGTRRVIGHLINKEEAFWTQLTNKYDPNHKFTKKYEDELREIKA